VTHFLFFNTYARERKIKNEKKAENEEEKNSLYIKKLGDLRHSVTSQLFLWLKSFLAVIFRHYSVTFSYESMRGQIA